VRVEEIDLSRASTSVSWPQLWRTSLDALCQLVAAHAARAARSSLSPALRRAYADLVERATSPDAARAVMNEVLGHLHGSHAIVRGADHQPHTPRPASRAWIAERARRTRERSNGAVEYLHLGDVSERTKTEVERWLWCHEHSPRAIIDLRYNEGGAYGGEIGELLCRVAIGEVRTPRTATRRIPLGARERAYAVVTNRFTSSGGELVAAWLRERAQAPIIGERTLGAGVGHDITRQLPDGSECLLPEVELLDPASWTTIENHGVRPDVEVHFYEEMRDDPAIAIAVAALSGGVTTKS
jgi:hypothetical protein